MPSKKKKKAGNRPARPVEVIREPEPSRFPSPWWSLAAILFAAAALRVLWLDAAIGGFHSFNEAHYSLVAKNFFHGSFLRPTADGRELFLETPPLYAYLLHAVFRVTGVSVISGRLLSVVSGLGVVFAIFLLARRLFGVFAGLAAALIIAVTPVAVLTSRNIQTDATLLAFLITAFFFYRRAEEGSRGDRLRAGVFAGLALFTKLFALIALAAVLLWELATKRNLRWAAERTRWQATGLALLLPALFYGYHALRDSAYLRREVAGGAAVATTFPRTGGEWTAIGAEAFWAFSPLIAILLLAGAAAGLARPSRETLFVLLPLAGFAVFYLFVHKHSYYLFTLLPFGAALAGRLLAFLKPRGLRLGALAAIGLSGLFVSAVDLTSMKLGFREFEEFGRRASQLPGTAHHILIDREMRDSYAPVLRFYDPRAVLAAFEDLPADPDGRLRLHEENQYFARFVPAQAQPPPVGWLFSRTRYGLTLFGSTIAEAHPNPHFFRQGAYLSSQGGDSPNFGRGVLRVYPALALLPVAPDLDLYRTANGLEARAKP